MSKFDLIPQDGEIAISQSGRSDDSIDIAMLDKAIGSVMDLFIAIDNGTDKDCLMSWVRDYINADKDISPTKVRDSLKKINNALGSIYVEMAAARRSKT